MAVSTCATNNITIASGESFILPPGASIIGVSNIDSLSSECIDLTSLETATCYVVTLGARSANNNGHSEFFEKDQQRITGYTLNNVYTAFNTPIINSGSLGTFNMSDLLAKLQLTIPAILTGSVFYHAAPSDGTRSNLSIKTFPSIANNLQLYVYTNASFGPDKTDVVYKADFITLADAVSQGYTDFTECP